MTQTFKTSELTFDFISGTISIALSISMSIDTTAYIVRPSSETIFKSPELYGVNTPVTTSISVVRTVAILSTSLRNAPSVYCISSSCKTSSTDDCVNPN